MTRVSVSMYVCACMYACAFVCVLDEGGQSVLILR